MVTHRDDGDLLLAWRARRDEVAFRELCDRHAGLVASICRHLGSPDPDEATQAVFLVLARRAGSVAGASLASWLIGTARRVVAHQRRAGASRRRHEQEAAVEHARHTEAAPAEPAWAEAREHLDAALASLSTGRREAVLRFYLEGRSQAEVAAELGCSEGAVKTRVHEGIERLRTFFARKGVALGAAALASGLAGESAAAEPALAASCARIALSPATAAGAATLATGVATAMFIKSAALACAAVLVAGSALTAALISGAEPTIPAAASASGAPPAASQNAAPYWLDALEELPVDSDICWTLTKPGPDGKRCSLQDIKSATDDRFFTDPRLPAGLRLRALEQFTRGARSTTCDWSILKSDPGNPVSLAFQLRIVKLRKLFDLAILRVRWLAANGNFETATQEAHDLLHATRLAGGRQPRTREVGYTYRLEQEFLEVIAEFAPLLSAGQRQSLGMSISRRSPALAFTEAVAWDRDFFLWQVSEMRRRPLDQRLGFLRQFDGGMVQPEKVLSDANLIASAAAFVTEADSWAAYLRRPVKERGGFTPLADVRELPQRALLIMLSPAWEHYVSDEIRVSLARQQSLAALAYLDRGDAGLAGFPDPLTGKPFRLEKAGAGFRLLTNVPGMKEPIALAVGDPTPPPASEF